SLARCDGGAAGARLSRRRLQHRLSRRRTFRPGAGCTAVRDPAREPRRPRGVRRRVVSEPRRVRVTAAAPARLDACVRALVPELSRRLVRALVADGAVLVNGRPGQKGTRVVEGDVVELPAVAPLAAAPDLP